MNDRAAILQIVYDYTVTDPEAAPFIVQVTSQGVAAALNLALQRACDMEIAATSMIHKHRGWRSLVLDKLKTWQGKSALRLDSTIAKLEGK